MRQREFTMIEANSLLHTQPCVSLGVRLHKNVANIEAALKESEE